jgi:hypothetical protein
MVAAVPFLKCQGPIGPTSLPANLCAKRARHAFYFPHTSGCAFVFACDLHGIELGRWTGRRFGGSYGIQVEELAEVIEKAKQRFDNVEFPDSRELEMLIPVPHPPPRVA